MHGIKHYVIDENEEVPYEFVVTRNVNGEPEFCASFVNTNTLAYGNGALLKFHQRNDELRAENAKLRELASILCFCMQVHAQCDDCKLNGAKGELVHDPLCACDGLHEILRELRIEVPK